MRRSATEPATCASHAWLRRLAALGVGVLVSAGALADVPRLISYQGRLAGETDGPVDLDIAFWDAAFGGVQLFAESQPDVALNNGVFSILIGAETIGGVSDAALDAPEVWIALSVDGGPELSPRTRMVMVPYAARARSGEQLVEPDTFDPVARTDNARVLSILDPALAPRVSLWGNANGGGGALDLLNEAGAATMTLRGRDNFGTGGQFRMFNDAGNRTFEIDSEGGAGTSFLVLADQSGLTRLRLNGDLTTGDGARLQMYAATNNETVSLLADRGGNGASLTMSNELGLNTVQLLGSDNFGTGGQLNMFNSSGNATFEVDSQGTADSAFLELSNAAGLTRLRLNGDLSTGDGARLQMYAATNNESVSLLADEGGNGASLRLASELGGAGVILDADDGTGGRGWFYNRSGVETIDINADGGGLGGGETPGIALTHGDGSGRGAARLQVQNTGGGLVALNNDNASRTVTLDGDANGGGQLILDNSASATSIELLGEFNEGGQITMETDSGVETVRIRAAEAAGQGAEIQLRDAGGTTTIEIDADFNGAGRIRCGELQLNGADFSERFDITAGVTAAEPGMVVCIDPANAGKLAVSQGAYDRKVAGIISGAGDVRPGMLMGQQGTLADGDTPVAMTGRVWTWCDADANGPITAGDLLTTSATPGHAMRVSDHARAGGAVIGKAMTALDGGQGMVLVLVNLQ